MLVGRLNSSRSKVAKSPQELVENICSQNGRRGPEPLPGSKARFAPPCRPQVQAYLNLRLGEVSGPEEGLTVSQDWATLQDLHLLSGLTTSRMKFEIDRRHGSLAPSSHRVRSNPTPCNILLDDCAQKAKDQSL